MPRRTPLAVLLAATLLSGGCGTIDNLHYPAVAPANAPSAPVCRVYGGVRGDWAVISDYPWKPVVTYLDYVTVPLLAAGNLVFDVIGDTLTLPYTAVEAYRRATYRPAAPAYAAPAGIADIADIAIPPVISPR